MHIPKSAGRLIALLVLAALASACASPGPIIRVDRRDSADLSAARTFAWVDPLGTERAQYEPRITTELQSALRATLTKEGLAYNPEQPDVLVNFYVNLEDRQEVQRSPNYTQAPAVYEPGRGYRDYRSGMYDDLPQYQTKIKAYRLGTLTVDIVDAGTRQLIWEGVAEGRVTRKALENADARVRRALDSMFEQYP